MKKRILIVMNCLVMLALFVPVITNADHLVGLEGGVIGGIPLFDYELDPVAVGMGGMQYNADRLFIGNGSIEEYWYDLTKPGETYSIPDAIDAPGYDESKVDWSGSSVKDKYSLIPKGTIITVIPKDGSAHIVWKAEEDASASEFIDFLKANGVDVGEVGFDVAPPATEVTANERMRASVGQITSLISGHIGRVFSSKSSSGNSQASFVGNGQTGLAAGDVAYTFGVWANGSGTTSEDTTGGAEFDSTLGMGMLGFDYMISSNMVAGMAIGGEKTRLNTKFNDGRLDTTGFTMAPYFAILFGESCSFNITGGYTWLDNDENRSGGNVTNSMDSNRWFGAATVYGYYNFDNFNITGMLNYTYSQEDVDGYSEINGQTVDSMKTDLGTVGVGIELGYLINTIIEVYGGVEYNYDTTYGEVPNTSYDRDAFTLGMGFRTLVINGITLDLGVSTMLGRHNQTETTGMINVRYDF